MRDPVGDLIEDGHTYYDYLDYHNRYADEILMLIRSYINTDNLKPKALEFFGLGVSNVRMSGPIYLLGGTVS